MALIAPARKSGRSKSDRPTNDAHLTPKDRDTSRMALRVRSRGPISLPSGWPSQAVRRPLPPPCSDARSPFATRLHRRPDPLCPVPARWRRSTRGQWSLFERSRKDGNRRRVTEERVKRAVEIYEANFDNHPIDAVAREMVIQRSMASRLITLARRKPPHGFDLLPPTTPGKKAK